MLFFKNFGVKCARCQKGIVPEGNGEHAKCMKAMGNSYHIKCFSCEDCNAVFNAKCGAYPIQGKMYCKEHALAVLLSHCALMICFLLS